jgi:hypothetical protein
MTSLSAGDNVKFPLTVLIVLPPVNEILSPNET